MPHLTPKPFQCHLPKNSTHTLAIGQGFSIFGLDSQNEMQRFFRMRIIVTAGLRHVSLALAQNQP
jgi:hypothetical protein